MRKANTIFPEVFTNEKFEYSKNDNQLAHADGLFGWALCMSGNRPPDFFGIGMVKIGKVLGISPTPEILMGLKTQR